MAFKDQDVRDVILATLAEIENDVSESKSIYKAPYLGESEIDESVLSDTKITQSPPNDISNKDKNVQSIADTSIFESKKNYDITEDKLYVLKKTIQEKPKELTSENIKGIDKNINCEDDFLNSMRERLLVLFEGLQLPENKNADKKLDITLCYLEYTLAIIDERLREKHTDK